LPFAAHVDVGTQPTCSLPPPRRVVVVVSFPAQRSARHHTPPSLARIASPPARQADLPLHYLCISASPTLRFPNPAEHRNRRAPGAIKKGRPLPAKVKFCQQTTTTASFQKKNNHHRIAAGKASLASHHRAEREGGNARGEAKASIKRRGGDEACRPNPSNFPPPPSLPHARIEILARTARGEATRTRARPDPSSPPVADAAAADRPGGRGGEGRTDAMEADSGKLFVGGISWETDEDRLREYFGRFGEVTEAVIMRDRNTGRARGFGFVVFADSAVAERVTMDKHMIDGRMVEAKKAVPRDDQSIASKNNGSSIGSPGPGRTRKIFVGGLASNVTEVEFRRYFEQFGVITDVVVMYDHNTQRPRGFGFITYDSEDAVDKALHKNFHELNGKMVEVKRAVPKEQSPGPIVRSPAGGQNYAMSRVHNILNGFNQGYNPNPIGGYGMRVDGRYGLLTGARNGFSSFGPGFGMGMNIEGGMSGNFGGSSGFINSSNGRQIGSYYNGSSNRLGSPIGYVGLNDDSGSILSSMSRNVWSNGNLNYTGNPTNMNAFAPPGSGGGIPGDGISWGGLTSAHGMGNISSLGSGNLGRGTGDNNFGLPSGNYARTNSTGTIGEPFSASANAYESNNPGAYGSSSIYGDSTWRFTSSEVDMPPFGHDLGNVDPDIKSEISAGYMGNYTVNNNQTSRGITS
ncbi:unnamed protein product, partial [Urochloa humidicola]